MSFILLLTIKRNKQRFIEKKNYYQILTIHRMLTAKKDFQSHKRLSSTLLQEFILLFCLVYYNQSPAPSFVSPLQASRIFKIPALIAA